MDDQIKKAIAWQRAYFEILDTFFHSVTGTSAPKFSSIEGFADKIRIEANTLGLRVSEYIRFEKKLKTFYADTSNSLYEISSVIGGSKLVLGGSSRFLGTHLRSVVVNSLYCDTILIPDPVLPWMEVERHEERFRHVQLLEAVHILLHLKPLVDANVNNPPIIVFPSWEKSLESDDAVTQQGISQLLGQLLSCPNVSSLNSYADIVTYVRDHSPVFLETVQSRSLLAAPGESRASSIETSVRAYEDHITNYRSKDWLETYSNFPIEFKVFNILMERYSPQYHLLENAFEFNASPLVCIAAQAHCFSRVSSLTIDDCESRKIISPSTSTALRALDSAPLRWLNNVSIESLAGLKSEGSVSEFRSKLNAHISLLENLTDTDSDRIAADFAVELRYLIANHNSELKSMEEKYSRMHGQTLFVATAGLALNFLPALASPITSVAAIAAISKFGKDKVDQLAEKKNLQKTLIGVLSLANN